MGSSDELRAILAIAAPAIGWHRRSRCDRTGKRVEATPDYRKQPFAGSCECNRTWATTKERLTANILQETDLVADRGRRNAQFIGGLTEAHMPRSGLEGPKRPQRRKLSHREIVGEFNSPGD